MSDSRVTGHAVEQQMRNWELARTQRSKPPAQRPEVEDFITISRQVGVPAEQVAELLGERLGWPVFGRSLLESMAHDDSLRQRIYKSMDQRDLKWWEGALYSIFVKDFGRNDYFRRLCETVLSLARQGNAIFVGRGCDRLLPTELGFRVRLIAPQGQRLSNFTSQRGLAPQAASQEMEKTSRERAEFLRRHFQVEADDLTRHDLTINLGRVAPGKAAEIIRAARELMTQRAGQVR